MFDIGLPELLVILVLALLVVGPEELPSVALRAGRLLYQFRRQYEELTSQFRKEIERMQREIEAGAGLEPAAGDGLAAPGLYISTLGAMAGRLPPPAAAPFLQASLLGAVCGCSLVQTAYPLSPELEVPISFGEVMPVRRNSVAREAAFALQAQR